MIKKKYAYKISLLLNGIFIVLFIILGYKSIQKLFFQRERSTIVFFGDSIIKGGNWNDLLNRDDIKNSGFPGFTTSHLTWLIKENVIDYHPKICILEGGINDIGVGIPLKRIENNFRSLIDTLISRNIVPIVQSTIYQEDNPNSQILVDSLNSFLLNYCAQKSIQFLDINSKLSTSDGLKPMYSLDGTHITESAYVIWGGEIKRILDEFDDNIKNQ